MLKNDHWIGERARQGMITPFEENQVTEVLDLALGGEDLDDWYDRKVISYGLSSYGYDVRLSPYEFFIFQHVPGGVINPKDFNPKQLVKAERMEDEWGEYFILPGNSYGLGIAVEHLDLPNNVTVICVGKSTYARCGIIANVTPAEAGWRGHLTLEFSNSASADCRIYANEGVVQLLFFESDPCLVSYEDRKGKYQDQGTQVVLAKV